MIQQLMDIGYNYFHSDEKDLYQKEIENPQRVCTTNDKLYININHYEFVCKNIGIDDQFEIVLCAEYNKLWWNIKCYSFNSLEYLLSRLDYVEEQLLNMFYSIKDDNE